MPDVTVASLRQWAVYWARSGTDSYGRQLVTSSPREILCRWEMGITQQLNEQGEELGYPGTIHLDFKAPVGSLVWEGRLSSLPENPDLFEIASCDEVSDLKGRHPKYTATLSRFDGELPVA